MDLADRAQEYPLEMYRAPSKDVCLSCGNTFMPHLLENGLCIDCDVREG
jgi:hypothetical protein